MAPNSGPYDRGDRLPHDSSATGSEPDHQAPSKRKRVSWLATARSLKLQGPTDLSVRLHSYLYGEPDDGEE